MNRMFSIIQGNIIGDEEPIEISLKVGSSEEKDKKSSKSNLIDGLDED
jgi:hypothetical protein